MNVRTNWWRHAVGVLAISAFGLTACEDTIVTIPEPTPADITITVTPASLDLEVGETAQVVATVSNSTNKAVTFSSSNPAVATVSAAGVVTAVSKGAASVIATAAADPNVQAAASVNVTAPAEVPVGDTASVVISSITRANTFTPVDPDNVFGLIDVTLTVERGSADALEVLLNGELVQGCSQTFGATGALTASNLRIEKQTSEVLCTINTGRYNVVAGAGVPVYPNDSYTLTARLVEDGEVLDQASRAGLTFNNADFVDATIDSEVQAENPSTGLIWHGGDVTVTAIPVSYSGGDLAIERVTFNPDNGSSIIDSDGSDGFSATFDASDPWNAGTAPFGIGGVTDASWNVSISSVTTGGQQGPSSSTSTIRLDTQAPTAGTLTLVAPSTNSWINDTYALAAGHTGITDAGVGAYTVEYFYSTNTALSAAQIASAGTQVEVGADIPASTVNTTYVAAAAVTDALGNTSYIKLDTPDASDRFGVDLVDPTIVIVAGSPAHMSAYMNGQVVPSYTFNSTDDISGFSGTQYRVRLILHAPGVTGAATCVVGTWASSMCNPVANAGTVVVPATDGYYELYVYSVDQAGNRSETLTRITLRDWTAPQVSNVQIPFNLTGGAATTFNAQATDNLDVARAQARLVYAGSPAGTELWFGMGSEYGTYGWDVFTTTASLSETIPFVRALYLTDAGDNYVATAYPATDVRFLVEDVAGNEATQANAFAAGTVPAGNGVASLTVANDFFVAVPAAAQNVCNGAAACAATPTSRTITAHATGTTGTFANPFSTVYFYWVDGLGDAQLLGTASSVATEDDGVTRTWKYNIVLNATGLTPQASVPIYAVGVDSGGDALMTNSNTNLSIIN